MHSCEVGPPRPTLTGSIIWDGQMKATSIGIEAFAPSQARHRSKLIWYSYLDWLFIAFGTGFLVGAGLMLLV